MTKVQLALKSDVEDTSINNTEFAKDVMIGLNQAQKKLSSKYFYNDIGSDLFDQITEQPEYYLTQAEANIIEQYGNQFFSRYQTTPFNLFELGSGNGSKTYSLLKNMLNAAQHFNYYPVDISPSALTGLVEKLHQKFPLLKVQGQQADYHHLLNKIKHIGEHPRNAVVFLGSNIGNYGTTEANELLQQLYSGLNPDDLLLIGMDLKKDYQRLTAAYNDQQGITAAFNLNLLTRMNQELGANFNLDSFVHYEIYNPLDSAMQSFLVSQTPQTVYFSKLDYTTHFDAYESIFVESSRKYSITDIEQLAEQNGFRVIQHFIDDKHDFADSLWQRL